MGRLRGSRLGRRGLLIGQACLEPLTDLAWVGVGDPGEELRVDYLAGLGFPAAAGAVDFPVLARLPAAFDGVDAADDFGFEGGLVGIGESRLDPPVWQLQPAVVRRPGSGNPGTGWARGRWRSCVFLCGCAGGCGLGAGEGER